MTTRWALLLVGLAACSSTSSGVAGTGGATTTSGVTTTTHMNACVLTTDKGNNNGVGAYCTPNGGQCNAFPLAGVCLADVQQSEWFCTRIGCQMDSDCGDMATCDKSGGGSGCVPNKCLDPSDAGADG